MCIYSHNYFICLHITLFIPEHQPGRPLSRNRSTGKKLKPSAKRWRVWRPGGHAAGNHVISWSCISLYTRPYILWISVNMIRNTYVKTILNFIHFITHTNTIHIQFILIAHLGLSSCRFYCMLGCFPSGKGKLVGREEGMWTASETKVGKGVDLLKQNCLETLEATSRASEAFWRAGTAGSREVTGQHLATASEELGWLVELSALISASFLSS